MAISNNPTRTLTIEKAWNAEINRRWAAFRRSTMARLRTMNRAAIDSQIQNRTIPFELSQDQLRVYMLFLQDEIDRLLLGANEPPNWQARYQLESYERALERTRASIIAQGKVLAPTSSEIAQAAAITPFTATPSLGTASAMPIHADALEFLYTRSYESLKGWTDAMARETRQILIDGVAQGKGIREIEREIVNRQNVSRSRARVIAQTETIQAYQQSSTNETERAAEELGEEILMRWLTRLDNRVRHLHAGWHGTMVTPKENRARIGTSPWRCRCGQAPVITEANTSAKNEKFKKEREMLLAMERK